MSILNQIKKELPSLSKAETRIAKEILRDPQQVVNATTADLARAASVSDPMISRFCHTMNCKSFPDFKVRLAQSLVTQKHFFSESVAPGDSASEYIEKRISSNLAALEYLKENLNDETIQKAVDILKESKRIEIYGMGGTASIAKDAQHKLFRLGIPTNSYEDNLMQRMTASASDEDTTIICFSVSGKTQAMIDVAQIGLDCQAKVIAITNPDSPLGKLVDLTITSGDELEDTTIYVPMTTRIVILTIVDILATGLSLALGGNTESRMKKIKKTMDSTKIHE